jgi:sulfur carrier protein
LAIGVHANIGALMICLTLNGEPREFATGTTVAEMLVVLDHAGKRVAVERNGEIVPRSLHGTTPIAAGDRIEIVVAVGGG